MEKNNNQVSSNIEALDVENQEIRMFVKELAKFYDGLSAHKDETSKKLEEHKKEVKEASEK